MAKEMTSLEEKLKSTKSEIRSLLISCPVGLDLRRFLKDFHECLGNDLPFRNFGYKSAWDFLLSMPDVVQIKETMEGKLLVPVENKSISHIHQLVTNQRKEKSRYRRCRSKKSANVNFNRSCYTIGRKKKSLKTRKKCVYNYSDDSSFISDFDELCVIRSDVSASQTMKLGQTKGSSKTLNAEPKFHQFSKVSSNSPLKLECDLPKSIGRIPTEIERFGSLQQRLPLDSEDEGLSSSDEVLYQSEKQSRCYKVPSDSDSDESELSESLPEFQYYACKQSNYESLDSKEEEEDKDSLGLYSFSKSPQSSCHVLHRKWSTDMSAVYPKDYSVPQVLPKYCSTDIEEEISYQQQGFTSCDLSAENEELSLKNALEDQTIISNDHDVYLTAFVNGIILEPGKVLEPYKDQFDIDEINFQNCNNKSSKSSPIKIKTTSLDKSPATLNNSNNSTVFSKFITRSNNNKLSAITSVSSGQTSDALSYESLVCSNVTYDKTASGETSDRVTAIQIKPTLQKLESAEKSIFNNSRILSEFKKMIASRHHQYSKLSESSNSSKSDETDLINSTISDYSETESLSRNIGRGSILKKMYDAYQMRRSTEEDKNFIPFNEIVGRGQFLKKLVERRHSPTLI